MRVFFDLLDNITNTVRVIIGLFVLCMMGFGMMLSLGGTYVVPTAIEGMAEKASEARERQLEGKRAAARDKALAEDGWSYEAGGDYSHQENRANHRDDDWGGS